MTHKQEKKLLEEIASGNLSINGRYYGAADAMVAKAKQKELEEKDKKSKAHFLIYNEGRQKELKRRIKAIALAKRKEEEKKRMAAGVAALEEARKNINDFTEENNLKQCYDKARI